LRVLGTLGTHPAGFENFIAIIIIIIIIIIITGE
jgi:hypothetical protein